jgi:hypothetical protein
MRPSRRPFRRVLPLPLTFAMAVALAVQPALAAVPQHKSDRGLQNALNSLGDRAKAYGLANHAPPTEPEGTPYLDGFRLVGHNSLGARDSNGDVWVHEGFAYVGTWVGPCTGRGVKIIDVRNPSAPRVIGAAAARRGTSAEDMVVRRVATASFTGDLMAVGIQRCDRQGGAGATYGVELWDVSDPFHPRQLGTYATSTGGGGVHELDLIQRGSRVYAALAVPFNEWFDVSGRGDLFIVDATNPRSPALVSEWGVAGNSPPQPGPWYGLGSFGASFDHSARFSADGTRLYVSYWDRGVITLDIAGSRIAAPVEMTHTRYAADADGDAHSVVPYGPYLLQNDEDFDPRSPAHILYGSGRNARVGVASESPFVPALWDADTDHAVTARVVKAAGQGCNASDYPSRTSGAIAVVQTPFSLFRDVGALCGQDVQDLAAAGAGAVAVVHRFESPDTSPQWWFFSEVSVPVLFTDTATADGMVSAGSATLEAQLPSWGYLRVFDAASGNQVASFDGVANIHDLTRAGNGFWSIHNTEVSGSTAYSSWYSNGIVALDLSGLPGSITKRGQFIPPGFPEVWGVFVGDDGLIYASDLGSGLWIIEPTFD